jgi:ankyrin repeat protein
MYQLDKVGTGTPINIAVRLGHFKVVEVLLKHCDESKTNNSFYKAELVLAVTLVHADVVHVLLKHGVNVHTYATFFFSRSLFLTLSTDF